MTDSSSILEVRADRALEEGRSEASSRLSASVVTRNTAATIVAASVTIDRFGVAASVNRGSERSAGRRHATYEPRQGSKRRVFVPTSGSAHDEPPVLVHEMRRSESAAQERVPRAQRSAPDVQ